MYLSLSFPSDRVDVFRAAAAALLAAAAIISLILLISPVQELETEINSFRLSGGGPAARFFCRLCRRTYPHTVANDCRPLCAGVDRAGGRGRRGTQLDHRTRRYALRTLGCGTVSTTGVRLEETASPAQPTRTPILPPAPLTSTPSVQPTPTAKQAHGPTRCPR